MDGLLIALAKTTTTIIIFLPISRQIYGTFDNVTSPIHVEIKRYETDPAIRLGKSPATHRDYMTSK